MNETLLNKFEIFEDSARIGKHPRLCPIAMSNLKFQTLYQLCNSIFDLFLITLILLKTAKPFPFKRQLIQLV